MEYVFGQLSNASIEDIPTKIILIIILFCVISKCILHQN